MANQVQQPKTCFVIGPIGDPDSPTRDEADWVLEALIRSALPDFTVVRADAFAKVAVITTQIILKIKNADLIVADLSDHNPNVFYELAAAHAFEKPVIPLIRAGERIPFDNAPMGTIFYSRKTHREWERAKVEIRTAAAEAMQPGHRVSNPITIALGHEKLQLSGDTQAQMTANVAARLEQMSMDLEMLKGIAIPGYANVSAVNVTPIIPHGLRRAAHIPERPSSIGNAQFVGTKTEDLVNYDVWLKTDGSLHIVMTFNDGNTTVGLDTKSTLPLEAIEEVKNKILRPLSS
jgi:hypothetical protein